MTSSFRGSMAMKILAALLVLATATSPASSQGMKSWDRTTKAGPDAQVPGWFINLGLTGARARIRAEALTSLEVAWVFEGTPAHKKLNVGDRIVGANGRRFETPHRFGYGMDKFGYDGPIMDFGHALEKSQGSKQLKGLLTLDVVREGKRRKVKLKLTTKYGSFSKTYPYDCKKTDRILKEACAYLVKRQRRNGTWHNRPHINAFAMLTLLACGKKKYRAQTELAARAFAKATTDRIDYKGLDCWKYGLYGIALAEYYLATREKWVRRELREIDRWLQQARAPNGGWGHRPWGRPGGNGYGAINMITMQAKMAWALMARCGIAIDKQQFKGTHDFVAKGTNRIGYVWYKDGGARKPGYADMGRTGAAALAHYLSPFGGQAYREFALRSARCIGEHHKTFADTHGSPLLGLAWTGLGAAVDARSFRSLLDHNRWYFAMSHTPEGTFYYQPNRDGNAQDYGADPRLSATAATALILAVKHKSLQVTGAPLIQR
jgi:hypothetical protein